jgi:hypothetical protein
MGLNERSWYGVMLLVVVSVPLLIAAVMHSV